MKKISLKNFSFLGMALVGVSAITTAFIPSKSKADASARLAPDGVEVDSSLGGLANGSTVTAQVGGDRSWTQTGPSFVDDDFLSATSEDEFAATDTNQAWQTLTTHNATADDTTATANE